LEFSVSLLNHVPTHPQMCPKDCHKIIYALLYSVIKKYGLNFVLLYFLNYIWYVNDLHNILKRRF